MAPLKSLVMQNKKYSKITSTDHLKDRCHKSISILQERCIIFIREITREDNNDIYFPDSPLWPTQEGAKSSLDIVFFGNFVARFLESGNWTHRNFRFWVLSKASQKIFVSLFRFNKAEVLVIPRYKLFPISAKVRPLPKINSKWTLVYAGRISATKNIESTILITYFLQSHFSLDVKLVLCGTYDNDIHEEKGHYHQHSEYSEQIKKLINGLQWKSKPIFLGDLPSDSWVNIDFPQPVIINLSTFIKEDFGVSIAQAQSEGWPGIISNWGGHCDVQGNNFIKIDAKAIPNFSDHLNIQWGRSFSIASEIHYNLKEALSHNKDISPCGQTPLMPEKISIKTVDLKRRDFVKEWGGPIQLFSRGNISDLADQHMGQVFFKAYKKLFQANSSSKKKNISLLINDLHESESPEISLAPLLVRELLCNLRYDQFNTQIISFNQIKDSLNFSKLLNSDLIILTFLPEDGVKIIKFLKETLSLNAPMKFFINKHQQNVNLLMLKSIINNDDEIIMFDEHTNFTNLDYGSSSSSSSMPELSRLEHR
jgi:hypothetical protein